MLHYLPKSKNSHTFAVLKGLGLFHNSPSLNFFN